MGEDADVVKNDAKVGCQLYLAASKMIVAGGSLPPRKRLLVGFKQNGWSISPPPSSRASEDVPDAATETLKKPSAQEKEDDDARVCSEVQRQDARGCVRCEGCENGAWQRLWKDGLTHRFCSSCVLLYSTNKHCPHCLGLYQNDKTLADPSVWLICGKCQRSVHVECESKNSKSKAPDPLSFVCPNCSKQNDMYGRQDKACKDREALAKEGAKSKEGSGGEICSQSFHFGGRLNKKRRINRESRPNYNCRALSVHREILLGGKLSPDSSSKVSEDPIRCRSIVLSDTTTVEEAAAAAKAAACLALKTAAAARATAAAKASVAAKAAVAARAALEAAALAARAQTGAKAELSCRPFVLETQWHVSATDVQIMRIKGGVESEITEGTDKVEGHVDDEEYARHLHRVMNSSPRITRSARPLKKKMEVMNESDAQVKVPTQSGSCSSDEAPPFLKPQLTRPRSVIHKESRRVELKRHNFDSMRAQCANTKLDLQQPASQVSAVNDNRSSFSSPQHSSPSRCTEHSDGSFAMSPNHHTVNLLKTSTLEKGFGLDPANQKMENLGSAPLPEVRDECRKISHRCGAPAQVGHCEAEKFAVEGLKHKHSAILGQPIDPHVKTSVGKLSSRVKVNAAVCVDNNGRALQCEVSEQRSLLRDDTSKSQGFSGQEAAKSKDKEKAIQQLLEVQNSRRDSRSKVEGISPQKVAKFIDKQKIYHHRWKPVSKFLSSVDKKRIIFNARTLSSSQTAEDEDNIANTSTPNGEVSGFRSRFKPFSVKVHVDKRSGVKETSGKLEAEHLLPRWNVLRKDAEAVSSLLDSSNITKDLNDDPKLRHFDALKTSGPAKGPNATFFSSASSASVSILTSSSTVHHS